MADSLVKLAGATPTFGYVLQSVPRGFAPEVMADPAEATRALISATERIIVLSQPHFNTVWVEDHFQWGGDRPTLEPLTALTYLAARHETVRFGTIVLCQSYRNPALVAKISSLLQVLTRGRFILGIGAGWKEDEYRAYGYPYPPAGERIDQLEEAVQIIRAMWADSPANFQGKHYRIEAAECAPKPDTPIPLLIAGGGEKKTMRIAARYADWWTAPVRSIDEYRHKLQVLASAAERLAAIRVNWCILSALVSISCSEQKTSNAAQVATSSVARLTW
jgi:alkanesulfonate monooxygenase SsuD/methylene tetrahydromethanopterin reductase-like flavin-dependent oxidoreductase (luciferase family)